MISLLHLFFLSLKGSDGVKTSINLAWLYGDLGRVPLDVVRKVHMMRYWLKLLNCDENCLEVKQVYIMLRVMRITVTHTTNWASQIKSILENLGLAQHWFNQGTHTINLSLLKQRIFDQYYQSWYSSINDSQRPLSYSHFKHSFNSEPYLDMIHQWKYKIVLTRFRLSSYNLEAERERTVAKYFKKRKKMQILCT